MADLQQDYAPGIGTVTAEVQAYSARIKANLGRANITSITAYNAFAQDDSLETSALYGNATRDIYGSAIAATLSTRRTKKFVQEVRFLVPVGRSLDFMTGTYYTHEDTHTAQLIRVLDPAGHAIGLFSDRQIPSDYDEYAGFATVTYRVSSRFDIQSGLRHSTIRQSVAESYTGPFVPIFLRATSPFVSERREVDEGLVSYLLTPRFRATSNVMAYARFASGYRPGSLNLGVSPSYAAAGVPYGFAHDQTRDYDIGLKAEFFDRALAIDASLYYIDWNDVQLNVQLTSAETNQAIAYRVNGGNAKSAGAELSVEARPFERTTVTGWIAYNDAKLTDDFPANSPLYGRAGDRLPIGTRLSGFVSARQDVRLWAGATGVISGQTSLVGDRLGGFQVLSAGAAPPRNRYPSYAQVDVRAGIEQSSWSANVHVNNLLDERGLLGGGPGDGFPANAFIYISPRAVGLSITRTF